MREINLLTTKKSSGILLTGIISALSVSGILVGIMLFQNRDLSANISDALPTPTRSSQGQYPTAPTVPQSLTNTAATALATGIAGDTVRYYETQTGRAFQVDLKTHQSTALSDKKLAGFIDAVWAPDKNAAVEFLTQSKGTILQYFNYQTKATIRIGSRPTSPIFSPDSQQIAYIESGTDASTVRIATPGSSIDQILLNTRLSNATLAWPSEDIVALSSQQPNTSDINLTLIGNNAALSPLFSSLENLETLWSRDGSKVLYSYFQADKGIQLWYMNMSDHQAVSLNVATGADKCAWHPDSVNITCGIPTNTTLSRDTSAAHSATVDTITTINTLTGDQKKQYDAQSGVAIGVINPLISSSESYFVFINLFDQKVYSLPL